MTQVRITRMDVGMTVQSGNERRVSVGASRTVLMRAVGISLPDWEEGGEALRGQPFFTLG